MLDQNQTTTEEPQNKKLIIYQLLVRYFGNKNTNPKHYGTLAENGCGKFEDITTKALSEISKLGATHVWFTGVIEHATMTSYKDFGIADDDPDVVKGIAGSPYAIKDYYDVAPDLAVDVTHRMAEFEALVQRTHQQNLKVIIDFIPNHVARTYQSDQLPASKVDLGAKDNADLAFDSNNDFYYIPGKKFTVPFGYHPGGNDFRHPLKDGKFDEFPAKVTGNNVFNADPTIDDWFETIKLNYGLDVPNNTKHFHPKPSVWLKMRDILKFWATKGVDGFRCDMVEMVPVEFWDWAITDLKTEFPHLIFIGEAYDNRQYQSFLQQGKFDFLYDKVGLYDGLKRLIVQDHHATVDDITQVWKHESKGFSKKMLRFLENHDETRIASTAFAHNPWYAVPAMVVTATLSTGPVMIYNGQEVAEPAHDSQGFSGNDGRSTIFDYWNLPQHQKWMNNGAFDGGLLNEEEKQLRNLYKKILNLSKDNLAIAEGYFYELLADNDWSKGFNKKVYAYVRYKNKDRVLILANFNRYETELEVYFAKPLIETFELTDKNIVFTDLLYGAIFACANIADGLKLKLMPTSAVVLAF
jgi:glycosidase